MCSRLRASALAIASRSPTSFVRLFGIMTMLFSTSKTPRQSEKMEELPGAIPQTHQLFEADPAVEWLPVFSVSAPIWRIICQKVYIYFENIECLHTATRPFLSNVWWQPYHKLIRCRRPCTAPTGIGWPSHNVWETTSDLRVFRSGLHTAYWSAFINISFLDKSMGIFTSHYVVRLQGRNGIMKQAKHPRLL